VEVRHPVTRQVLRDRFFIGQVRVEQAGAALSLVRPVAQPAREPGVGDVVDVPRAVVAPPPPPRAPQPPQQTAAQAPPDPEIAAVPALFEASLGKPPPERIRLYAAYVEQHPQTPYRAALIEDAQLLNTLGQRATPELTPAQLAERQRAVLAASSHVDR